MSSGSSAVEAPLVTWLYVPGDRPERFSKALDSGPDAVILDLEDAVLPDAKDSARANVTGFLAQRKTAPRAGGGPQVHVRVNEPASAHGARDLEALGASTGFDGVRVPKIATPDDVERVAESVGQSIPVDCLLESALGVQNAPDIAAHPAVRSLGLGEADLTAEMSLRGDAAFSWLRTRIVVASAAAGLAPPAMSAYVDVADTDGLHASCLRGRELGMFGRSAIHPRQLPVIRRAFTPTDGEIARAREIAEAATRAGGGSAEGAGAIALPDGRFIDAPVVAAALRTLALAENLGGHSA